MPLSHAICGITYTPKKIFVIFLEFKFTWASCIFFLATLTLGEMSALGLKEASVRDKKKQRFPTSQL